MLEFYKRDGYITYLDHETLVVLTEVNAFFGLCGGLDLGSLKET